MVVSVSRQHYSLNSIKEKRATDTKITIIYQYILATSLIWRLYLHMEPVRDLFLEATVPMSLLRFLSPWVRYCPWQLRLDHPACRFSNSSAQSVPPGPCQAVAQTSLSRGQRLYGGPWLGTFKLWHFSLQHKKREISKVWMWNLFWVWNLKTSSGKDDPWKWPCPRLRGNLRRTKRELIPE